METKKNKTLVYFQEGDQLTGKTWNKEFDNLECLRNYLRIKTISRFSLRTFVDGLGKLMTVKSHITPNDLTQDNYMWLQENTSSQEKFIVVNYKRS